MAQLTIELILLNIAPILMNNNNVQLELQQNTSYNYNNTCVRKRLPGSEPPNHMWGSAFFYAIPLLCKSHAWLRLDTPSNATQPQW